MKIQITGGKVLLPSGLKQVDIELDSGIITKVKKNLKKDKAAVRLDASDRYILPGFIDIHTNGIAGFDLTNGLYDPRIKKFSIEEKKYLQGLDTSLKEFVKHGTTLVGYTTLEASINKIKKIFKQISKYKNESLSPYKDVFHGIYMEGTFMKDKRFRGAHNPKYFFKPSISLFNEFQNAAKGNIKVVNVVPEWDKPAIDLIEHLVSRNVVCAAGHTSATGDQYQKAIEKGLTLAIHVLNGPSSTSFKPFNSGGALEAILKSDQMYVELIPDGYHIDKSYVMDIIKRKGVDKCIVISDSMFVTKMKNIKEFKVNNVAGIISKNKEYLQLAGKGNENSLFGSVLTMDKAFANLLTWFTSSIEGTWNKIHEPLSFEKALLFASNMCSANPAKLFGIYSPENKKVKDDTPYTGSIEVGKSGDIVMLDIKKTNNQFESKIEQVFLRGNKVLN